MGFSLVICTYMRPCQVVTLLDSVRAQTLYPDEVLIVDGSLDDETEAILNRNPYENLVYHKVGPKDRGLTKQRNFGIAHASEASQFLCFLDDDTILSPTYFEELLSTYSKFPDALGVGGYISNEVKWEKVSGDFKPTPSDFVYDGWKRKESGRFITRKKLGLDSDVAPGFAPEFSNGRSIGFLPPSGKIYKAEQLMGGVSSFRKSVFEKVRFSTYFEGYGLYEDADFCYRSLQYGNLYVNTAATLEHHHAPSGRPNHFNYGKMVVTNGWYVWRVRTPNPSFSARVKWNAITVLLAAIRFTNAIFGADRQKAFTESMGRFSAYFGLLFSKPKPPKSDKIA